jgi:pentatricopeptide repeat domain-containing protein 1
MWAAIARKNADGDADAARARVGERGATVAERAGKPSRDGVLMTNDGVVRVGVMGVNGASSMARVDGSKESAGRGSRRDAAERGRRQRDAAERGTTSTAMTEIELETLEGVATDLDGLIMRVERAELNDVERVLREAVFIPGPPAYTSIIKAMGKASQWHKALECYRLMMPVHGADPNTITCSALINTLGKSKQCDKAFEVFADMQKRDIPANIFTYSALVSACAKAKRYERAMEVFEDLVNNHPEIEVDQITYSAAISACVQGRRSDKAIEIFNLMTSHGIKANTITFNSVLSACEKCADGQRAVDTFNRMRAEKVPVDRVTFSALIGALDRSGDYEKALEYYQSMRSCGVTPDAATVSNVLSVCANARAAIMASKVYREAKNKYDIMPTPGMFNTLISALHRGRRYDMVYEQMYDNMTQRSALSVPTYVHLMQACERYGNWEQAMVLFEEFRRHSPMSVDANVWMRAFYACGRFENDDPVWRSGIIPGYVVPSLEHARLQLRAMWTDFAAKQRVARASKKTVFSEHFDSVDDEVHADASANEESQENAANAAAAATAAMSPSSSNGDSESEKLINTYRSAAAAAARCADPEIAESVLAMIKEEDLPLDSVVFGALVAALALSANRVAAEAKMEEMVALGLKPGVATYAALARASARAGDANNALALAEEVSQITGGTQLGEGAIIDAVVAACEAGGDWSRGAALFATWAKNGVPGAHEELQRAMAANAGMDPGPTRSMAFARDMSSVAAWTAPMFGNDYHGKTSSTLKASVQPFVPRSSKSSSSPSSDKSTTTEGTTPNEPSLLKDN